MGRVRLVSNVYDYIAKVEIRQGIKEQNIELNPVQYIGPVQKGAIFESMDGVQQSYRRSTNPADANSPLGPWYSNANPNFEGTDDWFLE